MKKPASIKVIELHQLLHQMNVFTEACAKNKVKIPSQLAYDLNENELALSQALIESEKVRGAFLKEYAEVVDGQVVMYTPSATESDLNPTETIKFQSEEAKQEYLARVTAHGDSMVDVQLVEFKDIRDQMKDSQGDYGTLAVFFGLTSYINRLIH